MCCEKKRTLSSYSSQVTHPTSAYPSFHSMKWPGVILLLPGWDASPMQGYHSSFHQASLTICCTHLYSWVEGDSVWVRRFAQEHNTWTRPGLEPRPFNPESSALIIWPLCLLKVLWGEEEIISNLTPSPLLHPSPFISMNYGRYFKTIAGWLSHSNLCYSNKS